MKFGPVPLNEAAGAILAHSLVLSDGPLKKGTRLGQNELARARASGIETLIVAQLDKGDLSEDAAALAVGRVFATDGLRLGPVFTGRTNLIAERAGVIRVDTAAIHAMNLIDEGLTVATLADFMRVEADQLVATVKVIPYGLPEEPVRAGIAALGGAPIRLHPFRGGRARLILTRTPGFKESLISKGEDVVRTRVESLGYDLAEVRTVAHDEAEVAEALAGQADLTLILGASATSDRHDIAPAAVVRAGGRIQRFGMPVDPGNLLFLGTLDGASVVGLPGCARSPALNGVDWVLERIAAGIPVTSDDIAAMGVGGLLKEMPGRPQPRRPRS